MHTEEINALPTLYICKSLLLIYPQAQLAKVPLGFSQHFIQDTNVCPCTIVVFNKVYTLSCTTPLTLLFSVFFFLLSQRTSWTPTALMNAPSPEWTTRASHVQNLLTWLGDSWRWKSGPPYYPPTPSRRLSPRWRSGTGRHYIIAYRRQLVDAHGHFSD